MKKNNYFKMILTIPISCILLFSCINKGQNVSNEKNLDSDSLKKATVKKIGFQFLDNYKIKELPVTIQTNFDNFNFKDSLSKDQITALRLNGITSEYTLSYCIDYRLNLSTDYTSLVVSYMPGENEIYSLLINYDKDYKIIDFDTLAYDEIAESCERYESKIESGKIEKTELNFCTDISGKPEKSTKYYDISKDGEIKASH